MVERLLRDRDPAVRAAARRARAQLDARPRPAIRLLTLGRFSVARDGVPVPEAAFGRQKARALLGALLAARGPGPPRAARRLALAQTPPERAAAGLRVALHGLRRGLAPELEAERAGLAGRGRRRDGAPGARRAGRVGRRALPRAGRAPTGGRRRGDPLPRAGGGALRRARSFPSGPTRTGPRRPARARGAHREALERLADALADAGRLPEAIRRYRRLVALEPEREAWHRALMRCYAQRRRASAGAAPVPRLPHGAAARAGGRARTRRRRPSTGRSWPPPRTGA